MTIVRLLPGLNLFVHHFRTIKDYEKEIYKVGSWSSWAVVQKGSVICYSTPEFEKFKKRLSEKEISKEKLKQFIIKKDEFDLSLDLSKKSDWPATKMLYAHIRRKLQILDYNSTKILQPDYNLCLARLTLPQADDLAILGSLYKKRKSLAKKNIEKYVKISKELTLLVITALEAQKAHL